MRGRKKMKKFVGIIVATVLAFSLVGCGHASPGLMARIPAQAQTAALAAEQTVVFTVQTHFYDSTEVHTCI